MKWSLDEMFHELQGATNVVLMSRLARVLLLISKSAKRRRRLLCVGSYRVTAPHCLSREVCELIHILCDSINELWIQHITLDYSTCFNILYTFFYLTINLKYRKRQSNGCTHIYFEQYILIKLNSWKIMDIVKYLD